MRSIIRVRGYDITVRGRLIRIGCLDGDQYKFLERPEELLEGLRDGGARVDIFTFIQNVENPKPHYNYPMEWDNFAALPVSTFDHWWNQQIGHKTRNTARQAEKKGVVVREAPFDEALVRGIWEIYNECPVRQGKKFPHYGKDLETVRREAATFLGSSAFIGAYLHERLIGFIKLTWDDARAQAGLMHILSMMEHRDKAPTNALIAQAVRACADRGVRHLVYSSFAYGHKEHDSLSDFKERNGFKRVDVPRYYVPLTRAGWVAFRFGLHHRRLVDYFPDSMIAALRAVRSAWYTRTVRTASRA